MCIYNFARDKAIMMYEKRPSYDVKQQISPHVLSNNRLTIASLHVSCNQKQFYVESGITRTVIIERG